jgi:putative FmdB family regulatory protein
MPMYDWKCTECGHVFEKIVSKPDPDQSTECPKCGKNSSTFLPLGSRDGVKFFFNYLAPDA